MEQVLPDNMVLFGTQIEPIIMTGLRIVLIVVAGWIILILIQKLIRTFRAHLTLYAGQLRGWFNHTPLTCSGIQAHSYLGIAVKNLEAHDKS